MPRYRVHGASRKTGEEMTVIITSDTVGDAEATAADAGVLVAGSRRLEPPPRNPDQPTLIEKTHKRWKAGMLVAMGMMLTSFVGCSVEPAGSILYFFSGAVFFMVCRIAAWWAHG